MPKSSEVEEMSALEAEILADIEADLEAELAAFIAEDLESEPEPVYSPGKAAAVRPANQIWDEYDSAAQWCAREGSKGQPGDPLPEGLAADVLEEINKDPEAFEEQVRQEAYALAMEKEPEPIPKPTMPITYEFMYEDELLRVIEHRGGDETTATTGTSRWDLQHKGGASGEQWVFDARTYLKPGEGAKEALIRHGFSDIAEHYRPGDKAYVPKTKKPKDFMITLSGKDIRSKSDDELREEMKRQIEEPEPKPIDKLTADIKDLLKDTAFKNANIIAAPTDDDKDEYDVTIEVSFRRAQGPRFTGSAVQILADIGYVAPSWTEATLAAWTGTRTYLVYLWRSTKGERLDVCTANDHWVNNHKDVTTNKTFNKRLNQGKIAYAAVTHAQNPKEAIRKVLLGQGFHVDIGGYDSNYIRMIWTDLSGYPGASRVATEDGLKKLLALADMFPARDDLLFYAGNMVGKHKDHLKRVFESPSEPMGHRLAMLGEILPYELTKETMGTKGWGELNNAYTKWFVDETGMWGPRDVHGNPTLRPESPTLKQAAELVRTEGVEVGEEARKLTAIKAELKMRDSDFGKPPGVLEDSLLTPYWIAYKLSLPELEIRRYVDNGQQIIVFDIQGGHQSFQAIPTQPTAFDWQLHVEEALDRVARQFGLDWKWRVATRAALYLYLPDGNPLAEFVRPDGRDDFAVLLNRRTMWNLYETPDAHEKDWLVVRRNWFTADGDGGRLLHKRTFDLARKDRQGGVYIGGRQHGDGAKPETTAVRFAEHHKRSLVNFSPFTWLKDMMGQAEANKEKEEAQAKAAQEKTERDEQALVEREVSQVALPGHDVATETRPNQVDKLLKPAKADTVEAAQIGNETWIAKFKKEPSNLGVMVLRTGTIEHGYTPSYSLVQFARALGAKKWRKVDSRIGKRAKGLFNLVARAASTDESRINLNVVAWLSKAPLGMIGDNGPGPVLCATDGHRLRLIPFHEPPPADLVLIDSRFCLTSEPTFWVEDNPANEDMVQATDGRWISPTRGGTFPDVKRVMPPEVNFEAALSLNIPQAKKALVAPKGLGPCKTRQVVLRLSEAGESHQGTVERLTGKKAGKTPQGDDIWTDLEMVESPFPIADVKPPHTTFSIAFNEEYVKDALVAASVIGLKEVRWLFQDPFSAAVMYGPGFYELLMPMRL